MNMVITKRLASLRLLACFFALSSAYTASASEIDGWKAFANGEAIALMRHAIAPGNGDPAEFSLNDCKTQRNLSEEGLLQAQQIGLQFKQHGLIQETMQTDIFSSQWCRCVDTAVNLDLGSVQQLPMLNSFYQDRSTESEQTEQLTQWIVNRLTAKSPNATADKKTTTPAILVTHQVNITALTGVFPSSGEVVFVSIDNNKPTVLATWLAEF